MSRFRQPYLRNEKGIQPWINLQGYLLGNPATTRKEKNYAIPFAHGMALISDELYMSLQKNCKEEYIKVDNRNVLCSGDIKSYNKAISGLSTAHILEPNCEWLDIEKSLRRFLIQKHPKKFPHTNLKLPALSCRSYANFQCGFWANDDNVRNALHVRKGSIGKWHRCTFNIPNKEDIPSSFEYHVNLSRKGCYRSLIYSGDHDLSVPFLATQAWIRSLNYSIVDDWRQWNTNGQVAGYTRTYSNQMTFATVKGGGHTAPEFKPEECFAMYSRWISKRPL
ncbi:hypothetical protein RJT34_13960 [Clitoria ternatea]|uniref:Uncharacterized protein n=1 Tax=Clitoria ternatea TaxID=43366 RepID=A0AAN9JS15_CLITE